MFGYVMPLKGELKVREYDIFRAYYCGLCREIGRISQVSRVTLTYDMAFLALLLSSIYMDREATGRYFCPFKMKKVNTAPSNEFLKYAAYMNIILSNRKLMDNYNDDRNLFSLIASKFIKVKGMPLELNEKVKIIDNHLKKLNELEKSKCSSIDETGGCFAELTGEIFSTTDDSTGKIMRVLGYNIGKWIYTLDAYDDLIDDIKKNNYNPFIYCFKYDGREPEKFRDSIKENVKFVLIKCLDEVSKAFELLKIKKNRGIIENIIYIGMAQRTMNVIERSCKNEQSL